MAFKNEHNVSIKVLQQEKGPSVHTWGHVFEKDEGSSRRAL